MCHMKQARYVCVRSRKERKTPHTSKTCMIQETPLMDSYIVNTQHDVKSAEHTCTSTTGYLFMKKGVGRGNQANGGQLFQASWPSSALCMPSCSARA